MPRPNGEQIRKRRHERGLSTAELATRVGFANQGSMRNIENGRDLASMPKLHRIARELGIPVDEVLAGVDAVATSSTSDSSQGVSHCSCALALTTVHKAPGMERHLS